MTPQELKELSPVAEALNAESNQINETIKAINSQLAKLNLGLEVWEFPKLENEDPTNAIQVGYAKVGFGKDAAWELAIRKCKARIVKKPNITGLGGLDTWWELVEGSSGQPEPLLRATRNQRVAALQILPEILQLLKDAGEESLRTIRKAKKIAADL